MEKSNKVYIARSIDGYIADEKGGLDWLQSVPNPEARDLGYLAFMEEIDALVMGRNTFEVVCGFDIAWPYDKPVFVLSRSLKEIPPDYHGKAELFSGEPEAVLQHIHGLGYGRLYIDGGKTIQAFLAADLIDEMIISTLPVLLGGGFPLFDRLPSPLDFELKHSQVLLDAIVQDHYSRKRR